MAPEALTIGNWGRRKPVAPINQPTNQPINTDTQQVVRGTDLAGRTVQTNQGPYVMKGPREGIQVTPPVQRLPATVATAENPLIVKGQTVTPPGQPDQKEIDIMVKRAKNEKLADDDLRFLAQKELAARQRPTGQPTAQDIANMGFEERLHFAQQGFNQQRDAQMEAIDQFGQAQQDVYAKRIADAEQRMADTQFQTEAQNNELLKAFEAEQRQAAEMSKGEVIEAGQEGMETLQRSAARRGMSRSSDAERAIAKATANTQKLVQQIELATNSAIRTYQVDLLDKLDQKMEKLQDRVNSLGDAAADAELNVLKQKQQTYVDLMSQDPSNPAKMMELADKLKEQQLAELKENNEAAKELRKEAQANFQFMIGNFGSQAFANTSPEQMANLASNLGLPVETLLSLPATLKEQEAQWDKLKYYDTQDFQQNMKQMDNSFQIARDQLRFDMDIQKLQYDLQKDMSLEQFKSDLSDAKSQKERSIILDALGANYNKYAISGDKSGVNFPTAVPHPAGAGGVVSLNAKLAQAYPDGYRFKASDGPGGLGGQCKWFAQQLTQFADGSGWLGGSSLAATKQNFQKYYKQGKAFKVGEQEVKPGMAVLSSDSKTYGHGYVINAIRPDGKWVVTESNYRGPLTVSNSRVVDPNDPKVIGVLKTVPKPNYAMKGLETLGKGLGAYAQNTPIGGIMGALGKMTQTNVGNEINRRVEQEYQDQYDKANQPLEVEDWQVNAFNQLTASEKSEVMRAAPEFYQAVMQKGGGTDKDRQFVQANQLANRYKGMQDELRTLDQGFAITKSFDVNTKNPYDDQALIFSFMKTLDPGSVVREGEFNTAARNSSMLNSVAAGWNKAITGEGMLTVPQRQNILNTMKKLHAEKSALYADQLREAENVGQQWGIDPNLYLTYRADQLSAPTQTAGPLDLVKSNVRADLENGYAAQDIVKAMLNSEYAADVQADLDKGYTPEELVQLYTQ